MNEIMNISLEYSKTCRACLSVKECLQSIYDNFLENKYSALTSLQMEKDDGLPFGLCTICVKRLEEYSLFRNLCVESHYTLKELQKKCNLSSIDKRNHMDPNTAESTDVDKKDILKNTICDISNTTYDTNCIDVKPINNSYDYYTYENLVTSSDKIQIRNKDDAYITSAVNTVEVKKINIEEPNSSICTIKCRCSFCSKEFALESSLQKHIFNKHGKKGHKDVKTKSIPKSSLNFRNFNLNLSCPKCGQTFKKPERLEAHLRVHAGKKPEVCKECNGEFAHWKSLKLHMMAHTGVKKYVCSECGKRFTYPTALRIHERIHTGVRSYICDICGNSFLTSTNLKLHIATHSDERPFSCETCPQKFKCAATLRMHVFRHSGVKNFICTLCGHRSTTKGELNAHMKTHSQEKPFPCVVCAKKYKTANELSIHNRTHTGERPFKCDLCPMTFTISKVLKHHRMTHTGEKPHTCDICQRAFTQKSALKTHMKTHDRVVQTY